MASAAKGAFTGAESQKPGLMEKARGGTLFLDEIATLPPKLQPKLLRALEELEIFRLGGTTPIPIDMRVIAATNRDLVVAMAEGAFREDLYYRLAEVTIHLPPLRDRRGDVALLIDHSLPRVAAELGMRGEITAPARQVLEAYGWPGNVRQVRAVLKEALLSAIGAPIQVHDLPPTVRDGWSALRLMEKPMPPGVTLDQALAAFERACIVQALEEAGGRKELAARRLGKDPKTLWRKLRGDRA
jgi:DNA-binding NtrC family response regulator